ncbi:MAG: hypothetical protein ABEJ68_11535 [Halobacteriaceae archaeon]
MADTYRPGQCNIGGRERRKRLAVGGVAAVAAVVLAAAVVVLDWPPVALFATVGPLFGAFLGYLQARRAFCTGFALQGRYDVGDESGTVTDADARAADKVAARHLHRDAAVAAVVVAGLVTALGVVLL